MHTTFPHILVAGLASAYSAISCMVTTEEVFEMANSDDGCPKMDYFRDVSTFAGCTAGPTAGTLLFVVCSE